MEIGGGLAGTLGPGEATAGGAINGPTGFVQGCLGGAFVSEGTTACFPVATAPAKTNVRPSQPLLDYNRFLTTLSRPSPLLLAVTPTAPLDLLLASWTPTVSAVVPLLERTALLLA